MDTGLNVLWLSLIYDCSSGIVCFPLVKNKAVAMSSADVLYIPATLRPQLEPYRKRKLFISSNANTAVLLLFLCKQHILFVVWC